MAAMSWGCSTGGGGRSVGRPRLEAVAPGMTAQKVQEAVGPPRVIDPHGGRTRTEVWHYDDGIVILDGGRVTYRLLTSTPKT